MERPRQPVLTDKSPELLLPTAGECWSVFLSQFDRNDPNVRLLISRAPQTPETVAINLARARVFPDGAVLLTSREEFNYNNPDHRLRYPQKTRDTDSYAVTQVIFNSNLTQRLVALA